MPVYHLFFVAVKKCVGVINFFIFVYYNKCCKSCFAGETEGREAVEFPENEERRIKQMPLTRSSKMKDVWRHPVGHDILQGYMVRTGRSERWPELFYIANAPLSIMDHLAGEGFVDMLLEMAAACPEAAGCVSSDRHIWWKEAVIYRIYVPSFMDSDHDGVGDLGGVLQRLPYLESLGVDVLWLNNLVPGEAEGGVTDYNSLDPDFGDPAQLRALIDAAHDRDMRVMMGLDIGATSSAHPWFQGALEGDEYRGYYFFRQGERDLPPNNWTRANSGKAWKWFPEISAWGLRLQGRKRMDLDWSNAAVRKEMASVLRHWLDEGLDGFYLGSAAVIEWDKLDANHAQAALAGFAGYERLGYGLRPLRCIRELRSEAATGGNTLIMAGLRGVGTGIAKMLTNDDNREMDMILDESHLTLKPHGRNEDMQVSLFDLRQYYLRWMEQYSCERWMTIFFESPGTPRLVSSVGAGGLYKNILAKLLGMWMTTLRGTPIIYQGEELGMANTRFSSVNELRDSASLYLFRELAEKMSESDALRRVLEVATDHAKIPFPWGAGKGAGFTGAVPWIRLGDDVENNNATVQMGDSRSVWRFYQRLLELRHQNPCLVYGSFNPVFVKNHRVFCYFRILGNEKWYVEMNLTERTVPRPGKIRTFQRLMLSNYDTPSRSLRPYEANLYLC